MNDALGMVLGRHLWWRHEDGWRREPVAPGDGAALAQRCAELAGTHGGPGLRLVFEPEGLAHQAVEMPRVGRSAFSSLERIRRDFPAVASEALGWGIEHPLPGSSGAFASLLHFELTPVLLRLVDRPEIPPLRAAWSAFTVAAAEGPSTVLFVLPDFVAVAQSTGSRRIFKTWPSPIAERDWKAVGALLGEGDEAPGTRPDVGGYRGPISVVAHNEAERSCPFWGTMRQSGRIQREFTLDEFAARAARLSPRHPANLAAAFPRPLELDRILAGATLVAAVVVALLVVSTLLDQRAQRSRVPLERAQVEELERTLAVLRNNEEEIKALQAEVLAGAKLPPLDRAEALRRLAAVLPDAATLTRLQFGPDDRFELSAAVAGPGFDAAHFHELLAGAGFASAPKTGTTFDPARGSLQANGQIGGRP